jgi:hypothetical protein
MTTRYRKRMRNFVSGVIGFTILGLYPLLGLAQGEENPAVGQFAPVASNAIVDRVSSASIAPGTTITMSNWRDYRAFMPDGMIALFEGAYYWKMPPDVQMVVGPTVIHPLTKGCVNATAKYSPQVRLVTQPDGGLTISGYTAGEPFPGPQEPHKGWKILANLWFRYEPHLVVNTANNLGFGCTQDSLGSINCQKSLWVYRRLSYNTDPGTPMTTPGGEGKFLTEWGMIEQPEQMRYTATLTIVYTDLNKSQDRYHLQARLASLRGALYRRALRHERC